MGKVAKSIGKAITSVAAVPVSAISGGAIDLNKMRLNAPLSSGAVRSLAGNFGKLATGGQMNDKIDTALGSKEAKLAGTAIGTAVGVGTGVGAAKTLAAQGIGALGAGGGGSAAAGSSTGAAGLSPGALQAGLSTASGTGGSVSLPTVLGTGAAIAGAGSQVAGMLKKPPSVADAQESPETPPPTPEEIAKKLEEDRASAEASARTDRQRRVAGSYRAKKDEDDPRGSLENKRSFRKSVLGGF